jgi:hypothetical protein
MKAKHLPEPKLSDLRKLPLRAMERKLLELHRCQGMPADEVAEAMRLTPLRVRELYASIVRRHNIRVLETANQSKIDRYNRRRQGDAQPPAEPARMMQ